MAQLEVASDPLVPGRWAVRSDHPSALAAVPDGIVQSLGLDNDVLSLWALHHAEQNEHAENAYASERAELGIHSQSQVVTLARAYRPGVVWVDRLHLVATSVRPAVASRLLGMYVGSAGDLLLAVHDPSVTSQVASFVGRLPEASEDERSGAPVAQACRFVVRFTRDQPDAVLVLAPQPMALPVQQALGSLAGLVAGW